MLKKKYIAMISILLMISAILVPMALTVSAQDKLFHVTLSVPNTNPSRQAWSEVIYNNMLAVGIDADRQIQDWGTLYDRALDPAPEVVGKTYDEGGFDILFVGYAMSTDPDPYSLFHSSQLPPGQNYYLWENEENDRLGALIIHTMDETQRLEYVKEWQKLCYDEQPSCTIKYDQEVVCFDPTALEKEPFEVRHYPAWPRVEEWKLNPTTDQTSIVIAQTGPCPEEGMNTWTSTSYYDRTGYGPVFDPLVKTKDLTTLELEPALATSWSVADDDKTWTVHLRQGVKWHDGVEFTAEDVKFTYEAAISDELASQYGMVVKGIIETADNIEIVDNYTLIFHLPEPYSYFVSTLMSEGYGEMLPKHILENVPLAEWASHPFDTCVGSYESNGQTFSGPVGTGPYKYVEYDPTTFSNFLVRNDDYWNAQALWDEGFFQIEEFIVVEIEGSDAAITALKTGDVDVLDSQYGLQEKLGSIEAPWGDWAEYDAFGVQEMGFNMRHPIFGTGVDTPLGQQDPSRAAEAARYVRQALSHLIPRQEIINSILAGYGNPGVTTPITTLTAGYDPSLQPYTFDLELAKSLLAAAGYDTGVAPPSAGFLEEYGVYIAAAVIVVVVAVGAIYFVRKRSN